MLIYAYIYLCLLPHELPVTRNRFPYVQAYLAIRADCYCYFPYQDILGYKMQTALSDEFDLIPR